jgi:hypothetical protein
MMITRLTLAAGAMLALALASGVRASPDDPCTSTTQDRSFPLQRVIRSDDAQVSDSFSSSVAVWGNQVVVGASMEDGPGDSMPEAGAAYVFRRNLGGAGRWGQAAKLTASDAQTNDYFGTAVAISGDRVVVGAEFESGGAGDPVLSAGAAYVFSRNEGGSENWGEVQKLSAPSPEAAALFGRSVAIDADTIVVGAPQTDSVGGTPADTGVAFVYEWFSGFGWLLVKTLRASDEGSDDRFGHAVAISGDTILVGAAWEDGGPGDPVQTAGAAYVFHRDAGGAEQWGEVKKLQASNIGAGDEFGQAVAVAGSVAIVGAPWEDGHLDLVSNSGAAYVFQNLPGPGWVETKKLAPSHPIENGLFGYSLGTSAGAIVVGMILDGSLHVLRGAAAVHFRHLGGTNQWGPAGQISHPTPWTSSNFGVRVAISGKNVIVSDSTSDGPPADPIHQAGAAFLFYTSLLEILVGN